MNTNHFQRLVLRLLLMIARQIARKHGSSQEEEKLMAETHKEILESK